jgi:hypothetical protein
MDFNEILQQAFQGNYLDLQHYLRKNLIKEINLEKKIDSVTHNNYID